MATRNYLGKATAVAQVATVQVTAYDAATTYELTVGGVTVSAVGNTDVNTTASDLADAWNASTHPYFTGVTASVATDTVTLTADVAGVPFVASSSVTGGTGTIGSVTTTTASAGPNDWSTAANWSGATVPVSTDTVVIANSDVDILWGLDQSAVTLAELRIVNSYTGRIGLPARAFTKDALRATASEDSTVDEYRDHYLAVGATEFNAGVPGGGDNELGSGRVKIDFGSVQTAASVFNTSSTPADSGLESLRLLGTHASNVLNVAGGSVGTATENASEVSTWSQVNVADNVSAGTLRVNLGVGCTLTTVNIGGGSVTNRGANVTTLTQSGGTYTVLGSATHTTLDVLAGSCVYHSDGTITTLNLSATFDTRSDPRAKTVTNANLFRGFEMLADTGKPLSVTFTNGLDLEQAAITDGTLDLGRHLTITPSAI